MTTITFPPAAQEALLREAAGRDLTTARRIALLEILWHERQFSRAQLIARVEGLLGPGVFGKAALEDTFYRDLRAVKQALRAAGCRLEYRRSKPRPGYVLAGEPAVSRQVSEELAGAAAEVHPAQIAILGRLSPAERAALGASLSDAARQAVAYRCARQNPGLSPAEAHRLALQRAYA